MSVASSVAEVSLECGVFGAGGFEEDLSVGSNGGSS